MRASHDFDVIYGKVDHGNTQCHSRRAADRHCV